MNRNFALYRLTIALGALALAAVPASALPGFQLPPGEEDAGPQAQGPVDPDSPVTRPQVIEQETGAPQAPESEVEQSAPAVTAPSATSTPVVQSLPTSRPAATATPSQRPTQPVRTPAPEAPSFQPPPVTESPIPAALPTQPAGIEAQSGAAAPTFAPSILPPDNAATEAPSEGVFSGLSSWYWAALALAVLLLVGLAVFLRQRGQIAAQTVPTIEPPLARRRAAAEPPAPQAKPEPHVPSPPPAQPTPAAPAAPVASSEPLEIALEVNELSRSMLNVTVPYTVMLANRSGADMHSIAIATSLLAAHSGMSADELAQASGGQDTPDHFIANLPDGEQMSFTGQVRMPLAEAQAIAQGRVPLLVPLLRLAIQRDGAEKDAATFLIGNPSSQTPGRLEPFRLDEMPRTYRGVASRQLG